MSSRTQIVCLCEGKRGHSIDEVFINRLMKSLKPAWVRPQSSNMVRLVSCGGRTNLIEKMPAELQTCLDRGGDTTLMVWADCDDNCEDADALRELFWHEAESQGIAQSQFGHVVFIFAKDRLENWVEFLRTGHTDESKEGLRVHNREAAEAAKKLASMCRGSTPVNDMPSSLQWSCKNWRALVERMR